MTKRGCSLTWGEFHLGHDGAATKPDFTFHLHFQPKSIIDTRGAARDTPAQPPEVTAKFLLK